MNRKIIDLWVGIFFITGLAATVFLALHVANLIYYDSGKAYHIIAEFDDIGSLKIRAPVKKSGVMIGRVIDISLDPVKKIGKVVMEIEEQYQFSIDSSASIYTSGILGEQYISIQDGVEEKALTNGDTLFITSSAIILEKLIGDFMLEKMNE